MFKQTNKQTKNNRGVLLCPVIPEIQALENEGVWHLPKNAKMNDFFKNVLIFSKHNKHHVFL